MGYPEDAGKYRQVSRQVKKAYAEEFIGRDGRMKPDKQASYVRILQFDLAPDELRPLIAERLVSLIRENDNHLGTGFLSTGYLCHVLTEEGYLDVAYELINQDTMPSWLYAIGKGATTIWEGWDTIKPDGSLGIGSHNHYSKGAVGEWFYRVVAGIEIGEPGYKQIIIKPRPSGGLTWAKATVESMYGLISSSWQLEERLFQLEVVIPPNTTAVIYLPDGSEPIAVGSGQHQYQCAL